MNSMRWHLSLGFCVLLACSGCPSRDATHEPKAPPLTTAGESEDSPGGRLQRPTGPPADAPSLRARERATTLRAGGIRDISFDDLEFPIERDADFDPSMITDSIRELDGKTVLLRGYILASTIFKQTGIEEFVLVRDNQECCFGPGAYLYHNAQVEMVSPRTASFSIRPVTVRGVLSIRPWEADGKTYSVFHIAAEQVQ